MLRYMAFLWPAGDPAAVHTARTLFAKMRLALPAWRCALEESGFCIYSRIDGHSAARVCLLQGSAGALLGTVFERRQDEGTQCPQKIAFDDAETSRILASEGRPLTRNYWGNYVALLRDPVRDVSWVLRGPASTLPCFYLRTRDLNIFFSDIQDCIRLGLGPFSIEWDFVAGQMLAPLLDGRTGLKEVSEVRAGECVRLRESVQSRSFYWNAFAIAEGRDVVDRTAAAVALKHATESCVQSWAGCYKSLLHNLSGGLDSSIVLACLASAPLVPLITCVTEYSAGVDSDERAYARMAAARAKCRTHVEWPRNGAVRLDEMLHAARSPSPQAYIRRLETSRVQAKLAHDHAAQAVFSGNGGDAIFYQYGAKHTVADFVHQNGVARGLAKTTYDAAQVEGSSVWRILNYAFRHGLRPVDFDPLTAALPYRSLLSRDLLSRVIDLRSNASPWCGRVLPPGAAWHAYSVSILNDYYDPMGKADDPEQIAPLVSQPLIELALRIPTYVLMAAGWDRDAARRAFANDLPLPIVRRRNKGSIEEHMHEILRANFSFARELLLDGMLVQGGLVDKKSVCAALADGPSNVMKGMAEIFAVLGTEVWLRMWTPEAQSIAA